MTVKIYLNRSVYEESLNRIRWIYDEFPNVVVSMSGGKDSTVLYHLTKIVAEERGRLPLTVMWLDQECEYQATADYMKKIMYDPDVDPRWYQIPFKLLNATSSAENWLNVWGEGEQWVREKDPISIKENIYGTDRFRGLLDGITRKEYAGEPCAALTGVRAEESPGRKMGLTLSKTYKWATWGAVNDSKASQYAFSPIYDWSYMDIWKAIHDNGWEYNTHYDTLYQYNTPVRAMRVSNYHHETAVQSLFSLQEIEPDTWEKATQRIGGLDTAGKFQEQFWVYELPFMFKDWVEYREYLLDNLILDDKDRANMRRKFEYCERDYPHEIGPGLYKLQVNCIVGNDVTLTKLDNWMTTKRTTAQLKSYEEHRAKFVATDEG